MNPEVIMQDNEEANRKIAQLFSILLKGQEDVPIPLQAKERIANAHDIFGLISILEETGIVDHKQVIAAIVQAYELETIQLAQQAVDPELIAYIPAYMARQCRCIPVERRDGFVRFAIADPTKRRVMKRIADAMEGEPVDFVVASPDEIEAALNRYYPR